MHEMAGLWLLESVWCALFAGNTVSTQGFYDADS